MSSASKQKLLSDWKCFYGKPDFSLSIIRSPNSVTLCRNVRAWRDPDVDGRWFVEPLSLDVIETDFSQIPINPLKVQLRLTSGVCLFQEPGEP